MTLPELVDRLGEVIVPGLAAFAGAWIRIARLETEIAAMRRDFEGRLERLEGIVDAVFIKRTPGRKDDDR